MDVTVLVSISLLRSNLLLPKSLVVRMMCPLRAKVLLKMAVYRRYLFFVMFFFLFFASLVFPQVGFILDFHILLLLLESDVVALYASYLHERTWIKV